MLLVPEDSDMPIQFPNFLNAQTHKPDFSGIGDIVENYYRGKMMLKEDLIKAVQAKFAQPNAEANLKSTQLQNLYQEIINQFAPEKNRTEIEGSKLKNAHQGLVNQFTPEDYRTQFAARLALANNRNNGGIGSGGRGVSAQQQILLQQQIMKDNPGFTPQQAFEAAGNLIQGNEKLNDGTPFNSSGLTRASAARVILQGTTAGLANQGVNAAQAEAEIPIADKYIEEGRKPYGNTVGGYSPQQISDMAKPNDKSAQTRLGNYAAADMLQMEKSALGLRMAGTQSGVTIIDEAMKRANQTIKNVDFIQTDYARQVALDKYREALNKMLKARKSVGILNSGLTGNSTSKKSKSDEEGIISFKIVNRKLVRE